MKRTFFVLIMAALSACQTARTPRKTQYVLPSASAIYPSPDGRLYATIRHTKKPYTVAIIERESGRVLGVAESSVILSESGDRMHGRVRVTYSDNLATIVVHEDFSDASPNPRYILFQRRPSGAGYAASYFAPPTAHTDAPGEFDFIYPAISRVDRDAVTLEFEPGRSRVTRISDLLRTQTPRSAEGWSSEAYKRYDRKS